MNKVKINLSAISYNLKQIRSFLPKKVKIMGIVKSDAYGHGLVEVSRLLSRERVDMLGVSYPFEAYKLVNHNISVPIVILCGFCNRDEVKMITYHNMIPVIWNVEMASVLNKEAERQNSYVKVFVKVDTGMGRLGIEQSRLFEMIKEISSMKRIKIEGLLSHLSSADMQDKESVEFTKMQISKFKTAIEICRKIGLHLPMNTIANSSGIIRYYKEGLFDLVRPGIILYGALPSYGFKIPFSLKPAMEFKGKVLQIRDVPADIPISYGRTYYTNGKKKIAIVSVGYGNGIPRALSNRGYVLIKDKKAPIIGRICMDLTICDISEIEGVKEGDEVIFMGKGEKCSITADEIAKWVNTIPYEILCSIGKVNKREYVK